MRKQIAITEKYLKHITYYQVATLLEQGDCVAEYPIVNDFYIKWGEMGENDNIWLITISLYCGETYIDSFAPFSACDTYAELAKGECDCIDYVTDIITESIQEYLKEQELDNLPL